ncbi:MAG TPA: DUF2255 family protein [Candidatus Binataceae bacterium]|nr:DUF2255 family protein [Candidatus Binataceae bacterium]
MTTWTREDLDQLGAAEELALAPLRRDGTQSKPVTIWVVRVGDELCVRSVNGRTSRWFRGTQARHNGNISAGEVEKEVIFIDADPGLNDAIDAAYRAKYRRYQARIVDSIVSPAARSATIRLLPRCR